MKTNLFYFMLISILTVFLTNDISAVQFVNESNKVSLENDLLTFTYDLENNTYSLLDKNIDKLVLSKAYASINSNNFESEKKPDAKVISIKDDIGTGKKIEILCENSSEVIYIFHATVYDSKSYVVLNAGIINNSPNDVKVNQIAPLQSGIAFGHLDSPQDIVMLNGQAGGGDSKIEKTDKMQSPNNLMVTLGNNSSRSTLVIGGLHYFDFGKWVSAEKLKNDGIKLNVEYRDKVGRLVDAGSKYIPQDSCYIDLISANPFESLEQYGSTLKTANQANPNIYSFPTVCLWYASVPTWGGTDDEFLNNSVGAVKEMEHAVASGFLKYAPVAVRLVPDLYEDYCEQGWWDDEHWQKYDRYVEPYETTEKWAQAILKMGGLPFTYFQSGFTSLDYAAAYPGHFLFNDSSCAKTEGEPQMLVKNRNIHGRCTYDYTDPGFIDHLKNVWSNLRNGGVKGVMFDYPETAWIEKGGFENKYATTASAYRNVFQLSKNGLGPNSYIHERNVAGQPFLDVTAGIVDNQRVWVDTDLANPEMYTRCALRWYKTRKVFTYDTDSKNLFKVAPNNIDGLRQMLSMVYITSGRLLLANSFNHITDEQIFTMSRVFPVHSTPITARPLDMLECKANPQIYDLEINKDWHQIAFFNTDLENSAKISVEISSNSAFGGMGLDPNEKYHVYDFWNDEYLGKVAGNGRLEQELRAGEVRMMSVHKSIDRPNFISTNRHLMQGYVELKDVQWNSKKKILSGKADVVGGETFKIVIAANGFVPSASRVISANSKLTDTKKGVFDLLIDSSKNKTVKWRVSFN